MGRKRKPGEGAVRLRKDGRWEGRVVIGYDEKNLPKTRNVLARTKAECVEKLERLKEECAELIRISQKEKVPETATISRTFRAFQPSEWRDSNSRPRHPKCRTLPTGLHPDSLIIPENRGFVKPDGKIPENSRRTHGILALKKPKIIYISTCVNASAVV